MMLFGYGLALTALTAVYALFLMRMRAGIRFIEEERGKQERAGADQNSLPAVSIILPARNEEEDIAACLDSLLRQRYPAGLCEILVVDDSSEDATRAIADRIASDDARVKLIDRPPGPAAGGKKPLITHAMKQATGEIVLMTDADCRHPENWLRAMISSFDADIHFVSGPVVYDDRRSRWSRLLALEFLGLVGIGAGFIGIGSPRLCNGANVAFRASAFRAVGGYGPGDAVASGDDEFLMQKISATLGGVRFQPHPDAVVGTAPPRSIKAFFEQRRRWASKGLHYADGRFVAFLFLLFVYFLHLLAAPICALFSGALLLVVLLLGSVKIAADASVLIASARLLAQPLRLGDLLLGELFHVPYILLASVAGTFASYRWKGRTLTN